jgi:serine/threonine-protein kinase
MEALSDDVRRHLAGLPVEARRGWAGYRLRKFAQRNRAAVAASALVLLALVGGVITTNIEAGRARRAQARTQRVNAFLEQLLRSVRPTTGGRDVPVSELLDAAAQRIERELADEPDVRAEMESVIGQSYLALGRLDDAEAHLRSALTLRREVSGPRSASVAVGLSNRGFTCRRRAGGGGLAFRGWPCAARRRRPIRCWPTCWTTPARGGTATDNWPMRRSITARRSTSASACSARATTWWPSP